MHTDAIRNGSYLAPRLEHARVADAMRHGVLSCPADAPLRQAARTMSLHHVHAIVVTDPVSEAPIGTLSDRRLLDALLASTSEEPTLASVVERRLETIASDQPLTAAADRMREHDSAHLLVRDPDSGRPVGVLSTLDIAGVLAWGEA